MKWSRTNMDKKKSPQEKTSKKPYQKPAFQYERVFETMALSCGKIGSTTFACNTSKKNS
jgi:hypothetical protein